MNPTNRFLLGIDTGTSIIKVALFDESGHETHTVTQQTQLYRSQPGWFEMDMIETWEAVVSAIRQLLTDANIKGDQVAGIGVTGNMIGAWLVGQDGQPIRNAILWCDARTQPLINSLQEENPGFLHHIYATSGSAMEFGCTLPLVRWLAENEPTSLENAKAVLCSKDWITYCLTGELQLDPTEASVLPGDTRTRGYSEAMFTHLGVESWRHLFPQVKPSEAIVGDVLPSVAEATGLAAGTPVVAGAGDVPSSTLGAGAVTPGLACTVLGTTCHNSLVIPEPIFEPPDVGLLFCLPSSGRQGNWLRTMMNVAGTTNLDWAIETIMGADLSWSSSRDSIFEGVESLAEESAVGANGLLYLPYLSQQGIIAPVVEPAARAQFFGMTSAHTKADLMRAVYEGVAYAIRDCYSSVPSASELTEIRLVGGGARSEFWSQMIADCLGCRVLIPAGEEFGAKGAALLAAVGVGWYGAIGEAAQATTKITRIHEPDLAITKIYTRNFQVYQQLRADLQNSWRMMAETKK